MRVMRVRKTVRLDDLTFSPDGRSLVGASDFGAFLWRDLGTDLRPEHVAADSWAKFARFTADGRWLFLAGHKLVRFDMQSGREDGIKLWAEYNIYFDLSPDGERLIAAQWVYGPSMICEMRLKCLSTVDPQAKASWNRTAATVGQNRPLFLPDGERFVCWDGGWVPRRRRNEYQIVTHATATGKEVGRSDAFPEAVNDSLVSPDGRWLAGRDGPNVFIWALDAPAKPPARIANDSKKYFTGVAFHPSGKFIAVTSNDKTVKLYDTATWELARTFTWEIGKMRSVCFSPDGMLAAAGSDTGKVVIWDVDG